MCGYKLDAGAVIGAYLDVHLKYAGSTREVFNAEAVKAIAKYSSGIALCA